MKPDPANPPRSSSRISGALAVLAVALAAVGPRAASAAASAAAPPKFLVPDGSRATAAHRIPLLDDEEQTINPEDKPARPYSPKATCSGKCHNYDEIAGGWHFNAPDPKVPPGRPGQPWILVDLKTGTQLPISSRAWDGTYRPADLGLTPWKFINLFGRHMPGGGLGSDEYGNPNTDPDGRWLVSGNLEIDCQSCHAGSREQDGSNWATNVEQQNFRWAATAAGGMALFKGDARTLPAEYDFLAPDSGDDPKRNVPTVQWDQWRFNSKKEVFIDTVGQPANDRCYYCHTNYAIGKDVPEKWQEDEDVHMRSGMTCSACHRNGADHMMTRNYEGEKTPAAVSNLTCRGCHLGDQSAAKGPNTMGGRLGAPIPLHKGLPTIHLEKLACTTCHSGPYPAAQATHLQTSRAHGLGIKAREHRDDAPPFIQWPVFKRQADGVIAPHKVLWPAFWGRLNKDGAVAPLAPQVVAAAKGARLASDNLKAWKPLTVDQISKTLEALGPNPKAGDPVYIGGGKLYQRAADGGLKASDHAAAGPYAWPLAHNVRGAGQSLGSGGCTDCHALDSPIAFGTVTADAAANLGEIIPTAMYQFQGRDPTTLKAWALSYMFRPWFKVVGFATAGVMAAVLLLYLFLGLAALVKSASRKAPRAS